MPGPPPSSAYAGLLRIREPLPAWQSWLLGLLPVLALLAVWFAVTAGAAEERVISPTILPSPAEVVASFPLLWFDRALTRNLPCPSCASSRASRSSVVIAFPLGVLMGSFSKVKATFTPLTIFGAYLPIPTLVPLTLSLFGTGEMQKVMFLALAFVIYLVPLFVEAVDAVDDTYLKTAYTLGASKTQAVGHVLLPISWPDIYQAMRLGFGVGWSYILLAEMVDVRPRPRRHHHHLAAARAARAHLPGAGGDRDRRLPHRQGVGGARPRPLPVPRRQAMSAAPPVAARVRAERAAAGRRVPRRHEDLQRRRALAVHRDRRTSPSASTTSRATASSSPSSGPRAAASRRSST